MKDIVLISILGESPGIITEALEYLSKKFRRKIHNIVLYSGSEKVVDNVKVLKKLLKNKIVKEKIGIEFENYFFKIPLDDITSEDDIKKLLNSFKKIYKKFKSKNFFHVFNVTGGRKLMVILLLKFWEKEVKKGLLINIISYLDQKEIIQISEVIKEKLDAKIKIEENEIMTYLFSKGNYKVFEIKI